MRSATQGVVKGVCKPVHLGRRQQVWNIDIFNEKGQLCCTSRLTTAVLSD
ncbi:TPA: hotdog fold thioesterase [Pseudomonas aeruginosa]